MAHFISTRPAAQAGTIPWFPGPLSLGHDLDETNNHFNDGNQVIIVSVNGEGATLEQNVDNGVQVNFSDGDFLLQTMRPRDTILLTFIPPVRAVAVQVAAFGLSNTYPITFNLHSQAGLTDGSFTNPPDATSATTTGVRDGSATCVGFACDGPDAPMRTIAFSIESLGPAQALRNFAVNQVTYSEQQIAPATRSLTAGKTRKGNR